MHLVHYRPWPAQVRVRHAHHHHAGLPQARVHPGLKRAFEQLLQPAPGSDSTVAAWVPQVDIREEATRFVLLADLPGVDPQQVQIVMDKGVLSLQGERTGVTPAAEAGAAHLERRTGTFHRRFVLPDTADADGITATGRHGVLEISIPKREEAAPRRIQVSAGPAVEATPHEAALSDDMPPGQA